MFFKFLVDHAISYAKAGDELHVSKVTTYQWATGAKCPDDRNQANIEVWTCGAVPRSAWRRPGEERLPVMPHKPTGTDG